MLTLYGTLFTLPSATSAMSAMGDWSSEFFTEFQDLIWMFAGIAVFLLVLRLFLGLFRH